MGIMDITLASRNAGSRFAAARGLTRAATAVATSRRSSGDGDRR